MDISSLELQRLFGRDHLHHVNRIVIHTEKQMSFTMFTYALLQCETVCLKIHISKMRRVGNCFRLDT